LAALLVLTLGVSEVFAVFPVIPVGPVVTQPAFPVASVVQPGFEYHPGGWVQRHHVVIQQHPVTWVPEPVVLPPHPVIWEPDFIVPAPLPGAWTHGPIVHPLGTWCY